MYSRKSFVPLRVLFGVIVLVLAISPLAAEPEAQGHGESFEFNPILVHHLMDSVIFELHLGGQKVRPGSPEFEAHTRFVKSYTFRDEQGLYRWHGGVPMHITRRVMAMFIMGGVLFLLLFYAARRIAGNPRRINSKFANAIEALVQWMRAEVIEPSMEGHSRGFQPYILTLFFFILFCNLGGLLPPIGEAAVKIESAITGHHHEHVTGATEPALLAIWPAITATGDISVTVTLSLITVLMIWITGFRYQGFQFLWTSVPGGVPIALFPLMWVLEFLVSPIAKGFALTIRLLANMTGGHVIILALLGFVFQVKSMWFGGPIGIFGAAGITLASVGGAIAIYFLEIMVGFLQAFIFAMLTALFVGSVMHRH